MDKVFFVLGVFCMMQFQAQAKAQEFLSEIGTQPPLIVPESQFMVKPQVQRSIQAVTPPPTAQTATPLPTTTMSQLTVHPQIATRTFKYHGNNFSLKFHRPSCVFARSMSPNHLLLFPFRFQAIEAGYVPCRYCLPPFTRSVKAIIMEAEDKKATDVLTPSSLSGSPEIHK